MRGLKSPPPPRSVGRFAYFASMVALCGAAFLPGGCPSGDSSLVAGATVENPDGGSINPNDDPSNQTGDIGDDGEPNDGGPGGPLFIGAGGGFANGNSNTNSGDAGGGDTTNTNSNGVALDPPVGLSDEIQNALDTTGYYFIPPGAHNIGRTIIVKRNQRLCGAGAASVLRWVGNGNTAVQFGQDGQTFYAAYLDNFSIQNGGLRVAIMAQHCGIDRLWVSGAPGDGITIDGIGERLVFRDVVAWGNGGHGIVARTAGTFNGVVFDHCTAQSNQGHGVLVDANGPTAEIRNFIFRDCTVQGNGQGGVVPSEILFRGLVRVVRIENIWVENITGIRAGIRTESVSYSGAPEVHPGRIQLLGPNSINLITNAIEMDTCYDCPIEQLTVTAGSRIRYRSYAPVGAQWLLASGTVLPF